jgi:hypothetical protein
MPQSERLVPAPSEPVALRCRSETYLRASSLWRGCPAAFRRPLLTLRCAARLHLLCIKHSTQLRVRSLIGHRWLYHCRQRPARGRIGSGAHPIRPENGLLRRPHSSEVFISQVIKSQRGHTIRHDSPIAKVTPGQHFSAPSCVPIKPILAHRSLTLLMR